MMTLNTPAFLLPILLLLQPSAMPASGGILNLAAAQNCPADYNISKVDGWKRIDKVLEEKHGTKYVDVYVNPEQDFIDVKLKAMVGGSYYNGLVSLEKNTCFPDERVMWWMVKVTVMIEKNIIISSNTNKNNNNNNNKNNNNNLIFHLKTGDCFAECVKEVNSTNIPTFSIMAKGTSKWRHTNPNDQSCPTKEISQRNKPNLDCSSSTPSSPHSTQAPRTPPTTSPTHTRPSDTPGDTENTAIASAVVVVVVVVGVVVMIVMWNRRRINHTEDVMQQTGDTPTSSKEVMVVVENSLNEPYEPLENFQSRSLPVMSDGGGGGGRGRRERKRRSKQNKRT